MSDSGALLSCRNVKKTFPHASGPVHVLNGINLDLQKGSMTAILGRSGTGKSTFLHILGTLEAPSDGKIFFNGVDLYTKTDRERSEFRNRHMGFVFQFHYLLPEFTALENVMMPAWIANEQGPRVTQRAKDLLQIVKLSHRENHRPMELSGGEQQRVSLARALMNQPEIILTDELTGNLDASTGEEILNYLQTLNKEFSVTILSVTHQKELAQTFYSRVIVMKDGTLHNFTS